MGAIRQASNSAQPEEIKESFLTEVASELRLP